MPFRVSFFSLILAFVLLCDKGFSQTRILQGTVFGNGEPVPGVNVMIKQSTTGTVTDKDGNFFLEIPENETVMLVFSFMGHYTERKVGKHENHAKIKIDSDLGHHAAYFLAGATFSKMSRNHEIKRGFVVSAGYRYFYHRFGVGAEINLQQGPLDNEHHMIVQLGLPVIGYYRLANNLKCQIGAGVYLSTYNSAARNDLKLLTGVLYEKRFWGFGLRYFNGTRNTFEGQAGVAQSLQFTLQYRVN